MSGFHEADRSGNTEHDSDAERILNALLRRLPSPELEPLLASSMSRLLGFLTKPLIRCRLSAIQVLIALNDPLACSALRLAASRDELFDDQGWEAAWADSLRQ
jgi:hypothetical protein